MNEIIQEAEIELASVEQWLNNPVIVNVIESILIWFRQLWTILDENC